MSKIRRLTKGQPRRGGDDGRHPVITLLAIATVIGLLPAIVIGIGPAVISTGALAAIWLLFRRLGGEWL